jgi:preprotein translocase subunit YajC
MNIETINWLLWLLLVVGMILVSTLIIVKTIRSERKRKAYLSVMKIGDKVYVPAIDYVTGEILEINGDEIKVVIKSDKTRVYPQEPIQLPKS